MGRVFGEIPGVIEGQDFRDRIKLVSAGIHKPTQAGISYSKKDGADSIVLSGLYAEAAHIQPLGRPHNGSDIETKVLCLCPNHHVMFDNGAFSIADEFSLIGLEGKLRRVTQHRIDSTFLKYHREHYGRA